MSDCTQTLPDHESGPPILATCSYARYRAEMGVPVATSVGRNPGFDTAPEFQALRPFGVFRVLDHAPLDDRIRAYRHRLHRRRAQVEHEFRSLALAYPGHTLVLLCWCSAGDADANTCHRRWAAAWFTDVYGIEVPELQP